MAQDDSRWQDLMKMQDTANSATNPSSDQPSGQFSGDDIEFEAFMFDPGTGPLPSLGMNTDPNLGVPTAVNLLAADLAAPRTGSTGPLSNVGQTAVHAPAQPAPVPTASDFAGQDVPLPPFLAGNEPQAEQPAQPTQQDEQPSGQLQPGPQAASPRGTGPLGLGTLHTGTNLAARLSQLQGQQGSDAGSGTTRGTGPLGMRRGTGPLGGVPSTGTGPLGTPTAASTAASTAGTPAGQTATPPVPAGPINPAYFKTPTGPLSQRMRTGPLNAANLRPELEETSTASTATAQADASLGALSSYIEQRQNDPNTWNDSTLSSVEDFSQVLLALYGLPSNLPSMLADAPLAAMTAGTEVRERPGATQEWAGLPFENAYSASPGPALAEPMVGDVQAVPMPGWGNMTGAPPESSYTGVYDEVAAPGYDGPQIDHLVPLEEAEAQPGGAAGAELEFDSFMFDPGHASQILDPAMVETERPAPQTYGMDSFLQPPDEFDAESTQFAAPPADMQVATAPGEITQAEGAEAEMEVAEASDQGPLPFWLQDTSDLEALARQGYVDMGLGTTTEEDAGAAGETLAMHTAEPIAPPEPVEYEPEVVPEVTTLEVTVIEVPAEVAEEYAEEMAEPALAAPVELEPAAEEDFAQVEEFEVTPFDAAMLAPQVEAETPEEEAALELAPTFQAEAEAEPQMELEAEEAVEFQAEPEPETEAEAETETGAETEVALQDEEPVEGLDYADLPPIEPFDFTSLNIAPEEDDYGFNTEELLGVLPTNRDPMRATANLDVLADIFDGAPIGSPEDMTTSYNTAASLDTTPAAQSVRRTPTTPPVSQLTSPIASYLLEGDDADAEETATQSQLQAQLRAQMDAQAQAPTQPEAPVEEVEPVQPAQPESPQPVRRDTGRLGGGWTSAVTTTLSMEGMEELDMVGTEALETGMLFESAPVEPVAAQPATPEPVAAEPAAQVEEPVAEADFGDIEPFDYKQLKLEEEQEIPTGMLDPRRARRPGTTGELISPDRGGSLWTERPAAPAEDDEDDEESWQGTERDTSLFMTSAPRTGDRGKSTGWLTDDATPEQPAAKASIPARSTPAATPTPTPTPEPEATPEQPAAEAQTEGKQTRGRKKGATEDSSVVKARVVWADATSPGLTTLPDDVELPSMTTGPLGDEAQDEEIEATMPQSSRQTRALKSTPEPAPEPEPVAKMPEVEPEPEPKKSRSKSAAEQAPVATPTPQPVEEPVEEAAPVAAAAPTVSPTPTPTPTPAPTDVPEYTYQPMQGYEAPQQVEMPKVGTGRDMLTSGPLPELEGFEALRQVVEANPDDIGAHMALAAGYSQLGDLNTTLRVYRRVMRKRSVPAMFLSLIAEELNDYEPEMQGNAHYHQVRGDLYMKQGRHQEAIQEYNKIK